MLHPLIRRTNRGHIRIMTYGLILVLFASLCWSILDILRKYLVQKINPFVLTAALCFGQAWLFLLSYGITGFPVPAQPYWFYGIICSLIALFAALGLNWALRISPLSQCIPMLCLTPAFAMLHGYLLLNETLSVIQLFGLIVSVLGAVGFGLEKGWSRSKGAYLMIGVAFLFSLTMALDKIALKHATLTAHAFFQSFLISVLLIGIVFLRKLNQDIYKVWQSKGLYLSAVLGIALAVGLQLEAVKYMDISLLEAIKRCFCLFAAIFAGYGFFKEPITFKRMASAILLAVGVCTLILDG